MKHTPGPWFSKPIYMPYDYEDVYGDNPVCWRVTNNRPWHDDGDFDIDIQVDTSINDALLIAAAPCLLEALSDITDFLHDNRGVFDGYGDYDAVMFFVEQSRAAIAKAKGGDT